MNNQNKNQIILAAVLGVVLVGVLIYQFLIAGGPAPPPDSGGGAAESAAPTPQAPASPAPARLQKVDVDLDTLLKNIEVVTFV